MINTTQGPSGVMIAMLWRITIIIHSIIILSTKCSLGAKKIDKRDCFTLTFFVFSNVHSMAGGGLLSTSHTIVT